MAVLVPILLLILLGAIDLGRAFFSYVTVANAAREGARYGSVHPLTSADEIAVRVRNETGTTLDLGAGNQLISVSRSPVAITDTITVTVRYTFTTFFLGPFTQLVSGWWGGPALPSNMPISARVAMPISTGSYAADVVAGTAAAYLTQTAVAAAAFTSTPTNTPVPTNTPTTPFIELDRYNAMSGDTVRIWGANFDSNTTVTILFNGSAIATSPASVSTGGSNPASHAFGYSPYVFFTVPGGLVPDTLYTVRATTGAASAEKQINVVATPTPSPSPTTTSTPTSTSTASPTLTPSPTVVPLILDFIIANSTVVSGTGQPGASVELRDHSIFGSPVIGTGAIGADGTFLVSITPAVAGHLIVATASNGTAASQVVAAGTPTVTATASRTSTATASATGTATPTATPPTPAVCHGTSIDATVLGVDGKPLNGVVVQLLRNGIFSGQLVTQGNGSNAGKVSFIADASGQPLVGHESYVVQTVGDPSNWNSGYLPCNSSLSLEVHLGQGTPTPTATSSPPAAPSLSAVCSVHGSNRYHDLTWNTVSGATSYRVYRSTDGGGTFAWLISGSSTSASLPVENNSIYFYYVTALNAQCRESYRSNIVMAVCGNTPTPTVTATATATMPPTLTATATPTAAPDLVFSAPLSSVPASGAIAAGTTVEIQTTVQNQGTSNVDSLFWVDLYINTDPGIGKAGVTWQGVSGLDAGASAPVTMRYVFSAAGTYTLTALVDSYNHIFESQEGNNVSAPLVITVQEGGTPTPTGTATTGPSPTPSSTVTVGPSSTPASPGSISGWTWVFYDGEWTVPTGRIAISVYQGDTLVASGLADNTGAYHVANVPAGTNYTVIGDSLVDNTLFTGIVTGVTVLSGRDTANVNIVLFPS